jgi:hypothetical protein
MHAVFVLLNMPPHPHTTVSMQHVTKNTAATPHHTKQNRPNTKNNANHKPSCGAAKTATPTQREK